MRTLIVQLPLGAPATSTVYAHALVPSGAPASALALQWAAAQLLPAADRHTEVVALLPALALSWHRVDWPAGLNKQPARHLEALHGLLEDQLLDEPANLHMALGHDAQAGAPVWVAVCERQWLSAHLQALEAAGQTVHRIVPEIAPTAGPLQMWALGDADSGWLWCGSADEGVWGLPLTAVPAQGEGLWGSPSARAQALVQAEPAVVAEASQRLGVPARLMAPGQHWWAALSSGWDLAQFEFQASARSRRLKRWQRGASALWQHRAWRPARWGLGLLVLSQLLGLNAWAWKTRADWQAQQQAWAQTLQQSFPQVQVVVDAPLQMAKEVARLRQGAGQLAPHDLEAMLGALGQALPAALPAPRQWRYDNGQLWVQDFPLSASDQNTLSQALLAKGYQWRAEGPVWLMRPAEGTP